MLGGAAGAVLAVMEVAVITQRQVGVSGTVEVPQVQFIAPFVDIPVAQQRRVRFQQGYAGDDWVFCFYTPFIALLQVVWS